MLKYDTIKNLDDEYILPMYRRLPALFVQGSGCSLWDNRGNEYLDCLAGIAVNQLGHCHPAQVAAITRQAQQLIHVSNFLLTAPQAQLGERLCQISGMERAFFAVCGATANETALKIAKKYGQGKRPDGSYEIVVLYRAFHGRTLGAISANGQRKYQRPFEPLIPGFKFIEANSVEDLEAVVGPQTAAILFEPIQGEGGVRPITPEFAQKARELCDKFDALLMLDEVQTGVGRTGEWFRYQSLGIVPDVLALAKGLGGGMPIGACLVRGKATSVLEAGDHGTTYGGQPLACAAALAVTDTIENRGLLQHTREMGNYFTEGLKSLGGPVTEVRGAGLMLGVGLNEPIAREVVQKCFDKKLILNATDEYTLRLVPPLIITQREAARAIETLAEVLGVRKPQLAIAGSDPGATLQGRDILVIDDMDATQAEELLVLAEDLKQRRNHAPSNVASVEGRSAALVFEKPSLRTRVAFEAAMRELGGHAIYLGKNDIAMGSRESIRDVAQNLSRWCNVIIARLYWHKDIEMLAEEATVPVINALTELEHPCQALADLLTIRENFGDRKVKITYVGDGNNVARSLARLAVKLGYPFCIAGPENFRLEEVEGIQQTSSLEEGLDGASVVYTDVWISMGDEHEQEHRLKVFEKYQVNRDVMRLAQEDAIFLHCLPARRGFEVTDDVIDSAQSRVYDQAENRLHAQKALLQKVMGIG